MHQMVSIKLDDDTFLYITKTELDMNFQTNLHTHPNLEILLFTDGNGYIQTTNRRIAVKKNSLVIVNNKTKHCEISKSLKFFAIGINKIDVFSKSSFTNKIIDFSLNDFEFSIFNSLYQLIYQEASNKNKSSLQIISNSLDTLLLLLKEKHDVLVTNTKKNQYSDLVNNIINIINNYYHVDIKLDEVAHRLSQSKSTICHEFKKQTKMTIMNYKLNKQLEEAANFLKNSDMSVSQIAILVGFNNTSYFTKCFRNKYNLSPKEYRESTSDK
ncbi:MAG: helix-turn-helix transcriptional regulator [Bacilli bacterium]